MLLGSQSTCVYGVFCVVLRIMHQNNKANWDVAVINVRLDGGENIDDIAKSMGVVAETYGEFINFLNANNVNWMKRVKVKEKITPAVELKIVNYYRNLKSPSIDATARFFNQKYSVSAALVMTLLKKHKRSTKLGRKKQSKIDMVLLRKLVAQGNLSMSDIVKQMKIGFGKCKRGLEILEKEGIKLRPKEKTRKQVPENYEERLRELCLRKDLTQADVSRELKVAYPRVFKDIQRLREDGVAVALKKVAPSAPIDEEKLTALLKSGMKIKDIAREFDRSYSVIYGKVLQMEQRSYKLESPEIVEQKKDEKESDKKIVVASCSEIYARALINVVANDKSEDEKDALKNAAMRLVKLGVEPEEMPKLVEDVITKLPVQGKVAQAVSIAGNLGEQMMTNFRLIRLYVQDQVSGLGRNAMIAKVDEIVKLSILA